jgi:hypothetical protein
MSPGSFSTIAFDNPAVKLAIAGARRLQCKREKTKAEPLSKEQLKQITSPAPEIDSDYESEVDHDEATFQTQGSTTSTLTQQSK